MKTVSLKFAAQLKKEGYPQDNSAMYWIAGGDGANPQCFPYDWQIPTKSRDDVWTLQDEAAAGNTTWHKIYASPSVDEILDILPNRLGKEKRKGLLEIDKTTAKNYCVMYTFIKSVNSSSLADALARMWLYLKERKNIDF